jgi:hypothetical protein
VLRANDALSALARQCLERLAELSPRINRTVQAGAARQMFPSIRQESDPSQVIGKGCVRAGRSAAKPEVVRI